MAIGDVASVYVALFRSFLLTTKTPTPTTVGTPPIC